MNFSFDASKTQAVPTTASDATTTRAVSNFTFGSGGGGGAGVGGAGDAPKPLSTGFALMSTPNQPKPGGLFNSGLTTTPAPTTGFTFGIPANTSAAATSSNTLTFEAATAPSTGIGFGVATTTATTGFPATAQAGATAGFSSGTSTVTTTTSTTGLALGISKPPTTAGFSLGGIKSGQTTGLTFGTSSTTTPGTGFSLGTASCTTTVGQTGFTLGTATTAASQPKSTFGNSTTNTTVSTSFALSAGTTSANTGFSFGTGTTSSGLGGTSLYKTTAATASTSLAAPSAQISLGTTTTVSSSSATTQPVAINFFQLEESINKWTLELEEQEKVFVNQATQVNAWDKLLITNGEKIVTLNQEVERVKIEQQQLEQELDYVVGQQKELQDCLVTLEKELASLSVSDPEREYTYRLAENLDTQLKQMSEDLKEIIEHLNEANRTQDSSDPIVQIGKILNAHMNSLQWLDQQTALLSQKIQQIDQMHQNFRQENERSFNLAYN